MEQAQAGKKSVRSLKISKLFPVLFWLKSYQKSDLNSDLFAGIITAILLIPQGIAYAMLAGLPVQLGLYASLLPPVIYALFGTSRTLSVGPVSIAAIMIASALSALEMTGTDVVTGALILAAEGGLILILMAVFRMGGLVNFISHPVLNGFTSGAAILIVFSQVRHLLGLARPDCSLNLDCIFEYIGQSNQVTISIGLFSLILLLFFAQGLPAFLKRFQLKSAYIGYISKCGPLFVVILATVIVNQLQLSRMFQVDIVGAIEPGLPAFSVQFFQDKDLWKSLLPSASFIAIIAYVESVAIAKVTANLRNQKIDPNQELVALGLSNIGTAFTGGMSVAGGFSRTMVNFSAGAKTQMATIIAVFMLTVAVMFFIHHFTFLPKATLAAIIVIAVFPLIKINDIFKTWKYDKSDGLAELMTLTGVLILGIEEGIALGVIITIVNFLRRTSRPHIAIVGRIENTDHFRNIDRHQVETWKDLKLIRIDENITFANISLIIDFIEDSVANNIDINHLVLICSSVSYIDTTALEAMENLIVNLKKQEITFHLSEVKGPVMDRLECSDILSHLQPGRIFLQTIDAVHALETEHRLE